MEQKDDEIREYVRFKASRLMSAVAYRKMKDAVSSWEREERAKSKVFLHAVWGLLVLSVFAGVVALATQRYTGFWIAGGFLVWVAYVVALMRRHLGTHTEEDREF